MSEMTTEAPAYDLLATALAAFQAEMPTVAKSHTAQVRSDKGAYTYTYAGLADVTQAAMPILAKHGLSFTTLPGGGVLTGMLLHKSGQSLTASLPINGSTPQQVGSSLTYMRRYLLGCMTGLVTDDDEDGQIATAAAKRAPKRPERPASVPASTDPSQPMTAKTRGALFALFSERGINDKAEQLRGINHIVNPDEPLTSRGDLTEGQARMVIDVLKSHAEPEPEP